MLEPPKQQLILFLDAERQGKPLPPAPPRTAHVLYYLDKPNQFCELKVDLSSKSIFAQKRLDGKHAYIDAGEMKKCEKACLNDINVQEAIRALELPDEAVVVCEPWTYSPDGENDMSRRIVMVRSPMLRSKDFLCTDVAAVLYVHETPRARRC